MEFLLSAKGIIIAILVLGVLVFVHELGHFLMAKLGGIGVDVFSIGFGKELWGFTRGETRYRIGIIPFGGYCKMRGDESKDRKDKDKEIDADIPDDKPDTETKPDDEDKPQEKDPRAMYNRPAWARVIAIIGGPVFNYIFAILVLSILFLAGFKETPVSPRITISPVSEELPVNPAKEAGLRNGDIILSMRWQKDNVFTRVFNRTAYRNIDVTAYSDIISVIALNRGTEIEITYIRDNATNSVFVVPEWNEELGMGDIGIGMTYLPIVGYVVTNSPAETAEFQENDVIAAFDGTPITYYYEFQDLIAGKNPGDTIRLTIERDDDVIEKRVRLTNREGAAFLGIAPGAVDTVEIHRKSKNFFHSFAMGFVEANTMLSRQVWDGIVAMFRGSINVQKNMSGPIRIIQITGKVATQTNFVTLVQFMALISVALGFFNLLPIPGLDGAHFLINTFEMVTTIKPSEKVLIAIEYVGLFFLITLSVLVFFNDIVNIILGR
jgi:regulator of sigma E protease